MVRIVEHEKPRVLEELDYRLLNLPPRLRDVRLAKVAPAVRKEVETYLSDLTTNMRHGVGLLILGPDGSGKSSIAAGVLKSACALGYSGYFVSAHSFREASRNNTRLDENMSMLQHCEAMDLLVLDDFTYDDAEDRYNGGPKIRHLIKTRRDWLRPTILTSTIKSGMPPSDIMKEILDIKGAWLRLEFGTVGLSTTEASKTHFMGIPVSEGRLK